MRRKEESPPLRQPGWHWHYCCKTQYASVVSDEHLLRCHLMLIDLLDSASIARFVGRLAEKLESDSTRTQSPIFEHPRFEHLEGEG